MKPKELVNAIHATPTKVVVIPTGGGTEIFPILLQRGGGSSTLLSGLVPYTDSESIALMGGKPDKFVSEQAARIMAMAAFQRALLHRADNEPVVGIACTSSLQKTPDEREGRIHHIFAALQTPDRTVSLSVTLDPDHPLRAAGTSFFIRRKEERLNAHIILNLIAEGCGISDFSPLRADPVRTASTLTIPLLDKLLTGLVDKIPILCGPNGISVEPCWVTPAALLSGSFNPMHHGHLAMQQYVEASGSSCDFELSLCTVDKPKLDFVALEHRLMSFVHMAKTTNTAYRVWITNAPLFLTKSGLFPDTTFLMGYDTASRLNELSFCKDHFWLLNQTFKENHTRFIVFGRKGETGFNSSLDGFSADFWQLATSVSEEDFRLDLSSTEIRTNGTNLS